MLSNSRKCAVVQCQLPPSAYNYFRQLLISQIEVHGMSKIRRSYPRVAASGDANILLAGVVRNGSLLNVSPSGIQIECRQKLVEQLTRFKSEAGLFPDFEMEFSLPAKGRKSRKIKSTCTVSHCRRLRQDSYHLCLNFLELDEQGERCVSDYIDHSVAA